MLIIKFLIIGILAGIVSGLFGVGGGLVIVPFLMLAAGFEIHSAIGTSLGALLLPVGLLGVMQYYKSGHVDVKVALLVGLGIFVGTYFGAKLVQPLSPLWLKRIYAAFLLFVAGKMIIGK